MPQSIPQGLIRSHILKALAELDAGAHHPFGSPTGYELLHEGRSYAPKAVIGLAAKHLTGRMLQPEEFSSGVGSGQAVTVLRNLGFNVVRMADDWTEAEVGLIVADYFDMLRSELLSQPYGKTEHRDRLAPKLNSRSKGSIEFKHQNISAVLVNMGLPYIDGYKPRGNYQALLGRAVESHLDAHPGFFEALAEAERISPTAAPAIGAAPVGQLFVPPPDQIIVPREPSQPWLSRRGRKIDFAQRDAENRRLGKLGEQWVVEVERRRLAACGRDDLARKVEWVAQSCGDGLGFDVLSYSEEDDRERFVEVKTTGLGQFFPFLVTANEVRCSEAVPEKYRLYRVFNFSTSTRLYMLPGSLRQRCNLDPVLYRASI